MKHFDYTEYISVEKLEKINAALYKLLGVSIVLFKKGQAFSVETVNSDLCKLVLSTHFGQTRCKQCIRQLMDQVSESKMPAISRCHIGLFEFMLPVIADGLIIGYVLGSCRPSDFANSRDDNRKAARDIEADEMKYLEELSKLRSVEKNTLKNVIMFLSMFTELLTDLTYEKFEIGLNHEKEKVIRFIVEAINSSFDIDNILTIVCRELANLLRSETSLIVKISNDGTTEILESFTTINSNLNNFVSGILTNKEACQFFKNYLFTDKSINMLNQELFDAPETPKLIKDAFAKVNGFSAIVSSMQTSENYRLFLIAGNRNVNWLWTSEDINFLSILAKQISNALKQANLYNELFMKSQTEQAILNSLPFPTWLKNKQGEYLEVNEAFCKKHNIEHDFIVGKNDFDLYDADDVAKKYKEEDDIVLSFNDRFVVEHKNNEENNHPGWQEVSKSPVLDENGKPYATVGFVNDITQKKELEKLKDGLISIMVHELRTPLASIKGGLDLLLSGMAGEVPPKALEMLKVLKANTNRLIKLSDDVLDIDGLESGNMKFYFDSYDVVSCANIAIDQLEAYAKEKGISFEKEYDFETKVLVTDSVRFVQLLDKLLVNAINFSGRVDSDKNGIVTVKINDDVQGIKFSIINRGKTIPQNVRDDIFDKFFQVDTSDSRKNGGVGLGLAISRKIADKLNAKLKVSSEQEQTIFEVILPKERVL